MKNKILLIIAIFMLCFAETNVLASDYIDLQEYGEGCPVIDVPDVLSATQELEIESYVENIRTRYGIDAAIVIDDVMTSASAMEAADDIYDYLGYGVGVDDDGMLLYISTVNREFWFTTHAKAMNIVNDDALVYIEKQIMPHLSGDNYYNACVEYLSSVEYICDYTEQGKVFGESISSISLPFSPITIFFFPIVVGFIYLFAQIKLMKTAVKQSNAHNYVKLGTMQITNSKDVFLNATITKTRKQSSSSGGGRSSSHRSSSGRSHGGRGGRF